MNFRLFSTTIVLMFTVCSFANAAVFNCTSADTVCLIDAINSANVNGEDDTINLEGGTYLLTTVDNMDDGANGLPSIDTSIEINGNGATISRDESSPPFRIFHISLSGQLILREVSVAGGLATLSGSPGDTGGGIYISGITTLVDSGITGNEAVKGGGIYIAEQGELQVTNSTISGNYATDDGGGIVVINSMTIEGSTISNNIADSLGGGISAWLGGDFDYPEGDEVVITNSTVSFNKSGGYGGGIDFNADLDGGGALYIKNSTISHNEADEGGGGISLGGALFMTNSTASYNEAREGGAINAGFHSYFNMGLSTLSFNKATEKGGAIYMGYYGGGFIKLSTLSNNDAGNSGGGIFGNNTLLELGQTIVANSTSGNCAGVRIYSIGHNLEDANTCGFTESTDIINMDPRLGTFIDTGDPGEGYFPLLPDSPGIDTGNDMGPGYADCTLSDQIGNRRIDGDGNGCINCDIGAIEFQNELLIDLSGTIKTPAGQDICAMVLASGQYMFSCNPDGDFSLTSLPRENDGTVKRQIYADGFMPEIDIRAGSTDEAVVMWPSGTCPDYNLPYDAGVYPDSAGKRINITGKVLLQDSQTPVCAMVLANGQYMFSCGGTGSYALNIPLDNNGQFKLQVYADGFSPTIQTFDEFKTINDVRMARAVECRQ